MFPATVTRALAAIAVTVGCCVAVRAQDVGYGSHSVPKKVVSDVKAQLDKKDVDAVPEQMLRLLKYAQVKRPGLHEFHTKEDDEGLMRSITATFIHLSTQLRDTDAEKYLELEKAIVGGVREDSIHSLRTATMVLPDSVGRARLLDKLAPLYAKSRDYQRAELVWMQNLYREPHPGFDEKVRNELVAAAAKGLSAMWSDIGLDYDARRLAIEFKQSVPETAKQALPPISMPGRFIVEVESKSGPEYHVDLRRFVYGRGYGTRRDDRTGFEYPVDDTHVAASLQGASIRVGMSRLLVVDQSRGRLLHEFDNPTSYQREPVNHLAFVSSVSAGLGPRSFRAVSLLPDTLGTFWEAATHGSLRPPLFGGFDGKPRLDCHVGTCQSRFAYVREEDAIVCRDVLDGALHWVREMPLDKHSNSVVGSDQLLLVEQGDTLWSFDPATGNMLTKTTESPALEGFPVEHREAYGGSVYATCCSDPQNLGLQRVRLLDYSQGAPKVVLEEASVPIARLGGGQTHVIARTKDDTSLLRFIHVRSREVDEVLLPDPLPGMRCFEDELRYYVWSYRKAAKNDHRFNRMPIKDERAFYAGQIFAIDKASRKLLWQQKCKPFVNLTPVYPELPLQVRFEAEVSGRVYRLPEATADYYTKYGIRIIDTRNGETVFEKKSLTDFLPELSYLDAERKVMHFLCPTAHIKVAMKWER